VFALVGWLALLGLKRLRNLFPHQGWRFAITSLQRRPGATVVQIVSLSLGLMALLVLTVVRGDLMSAWRLATPADAPNRFIINIQPDQKRRRGAADRGAGVAAPVLYPMIRGRLVAVNGNAVTKDTYKEDRARGLADREFNLSSTAACRTGTRSSAAPGTAMRPAWPKPRSSRASRRPCA
jgi:putative ABC transport system permease protein